MLPGSPPFENMLKSFVDQRHGLHSKQMDGTPDDSDSDTPHSLLLKVQNNKALVMIGVVTAHPTIT